MFFRFTCTNQTSKGSISTVVSTEGRNTARENIINVFGPKQISTLIDVELSLPEEPILKEYDLQLVPGDALPFSFEFSISSVIHGHGRSTADRQFYYINSRPCEPTKIMKLVNETYRHFNSHQYPFVYLNITMEKAQVDVNVTPDKRQIFLAKEKLLLATVKASLMEAFKAFPSTYKIQNVGIAKINEKGDNGNKTLNQSIRGLKRAVEDKKETSSSEIKSGKIFDTFRKRSKTEDEENASLPLIEINTLKEVLPQDTNFEKIICKLVREPKQVINEDVVVESKPTLDGLKTANDSVCQSEAIQGCSKSITMDVDDSVDSFIVLDQGRKNQARHTVMLDVTMQNIRSALEPLNKISAEEKEFAVKFRSKISPDGNEKAEKELQKQISKNMFKEMEIIGQFNHGFIIAKLNNDLFIIDQHATDEKYNFEQLQLTTVLEQQVLVK